MDNESCDHRIYINNNYFLSQISLNPYGPIKYEYNCTIIRKVFSSQWAYRYKYGVVGTWEISCQIRPPLKFWVVISLTFSKTTILIIL